MIREYFEEYFEEFDNLKAKLSSQYFREILRSKQNKIPER